MSPGGGSVLASRCHLPALSPRGLRSYPVLPYSRPGFGEGGSSAGVLRGGLCDPCGLTRCPFLFPESWWKRRRHFQESEWRPSFAWSVEVSCLCVAVLEVRLRLSAGLRGGRRRGFPKSTGLARPGAPRSVASASDVRCKLTFRSRLPLITTRASFHLPPAAPGSVHRPQSNSDRGSKGADARSASGGEPSNRSVLAER